MSAQESIQQTTETIRSEHNMDAVIVLGAATTGETMNGSLFIAGMSGNMNTIHGMLARYLRVLQRMDDETEIEP